MIKANSIYFSYTSDNRYAISDVSLDVKDNEFLAIVGKTGSGKSTFIQNLNGLLVPNKGNVLVNDYEISNKHKLKNIKDVRAKVGIVFQFPEYQLFCETVSKDILFGPKNFGYDEDACKNIVSDTLKLVGLDDSFAEKSPFELSGGEKRRIAIAGILAFNPDVLIVDEPTVGLDPLSADSMMDLFAKLHKMGKTIILVTHNMDIVYKYATRVVVFDNGKLVSDSSPVELFKDEKKTSMYNLALPSIVSLINSIKGKYPNIEKENIKDVDSLVNYLTKVK